MKISEIIKDKYKLRIPPTVYYDLLADVVEAEEDQEPKTGHWEQYGDSWEDKFKCSECGKEQPKILCGKQIIGDWSDYCPNCGADMRGGTDADTN